MRNLIFTILFLLSVGGSLQTLRAEDAPAPRPQLRIEMLPAVSGTPADFVVLLTNDSTNRFVLFDETCSFGYENLSFEITVIP